MKIFREVKGSPEPEEGKEKDQERVSLSKDTVKEDEVPEEK